MHRPTHVFVTLAMLTAVNLGWPRTLIRGRNEGTVSIPASNVMGNRNLTLFADLGGMLNEERLGADFGVGGKIGLADIMQLEGRFSIADFSGLGPSEAHLQITIPRNDRLRFFGIALSGDLYLSTSLDTISQATDADKPIFNPQLLWSIIIDLDWLAVLKAAPIKTYALFALVDDPQLLYRYNQIAMTGGLEWKMYRHALFVEGGMALYQEKGHRLNNNVPDDSYEQIHGWVRPGGRYRFADRFSLVGGLGLTLFRRTKGSNGLIPRQLTLDVRMEAPLAFRETNTEAIRTLVFQEQKKQELKERGRTAMAGSADSAATAIPDFLPPVLEEEGAESWDPDKAKDELLKRRLETQKTMEEIEALLNEIEE